MSYSFKQVIVVRSDLKMSKGKIAVQVAHAALEASEIARVKYRSWWEKWREEGQCKIAVKCSSEKELIDLEEEAKKLGLPTALIRDRGLTEVPPGTITCLGIGPAPSELVDKITRKLPLL